MNSYRHIYLYAKGWYKRRDSIEDLQKILSVRSGVKADAISTDTIIQILTELAFKEIDGKYKFIEFLLRLAMPNNKEDCQTKIINQLLSKLALSTRVRDLGKPDPNILPLEETL